MTRPLHLGVGLAATFVLGACAGPSIVSIGTTNTTNTTKTPTNPIFLSPDHGSDANCCATRELPWRTFRQALPYLAPGSTLVLLDGVYGSATKTGYLRVRCDSGTTDAGSPGSWPDVIHAQNGASGMPVTVKADDGQERLAILSGDESGPPLTIDACANWTFAGLRVESSELVKTAGAADAGGADAGSPAIDAGSAVVVGFDNTELVFQRLLARHQSGTLAPVLSINDNSSFVTVEECELYDFLGDGISASRTDSLRLLRNYINSRNATSGYGIFLEETRSTVAANNVLEGGGNGIALVGRAADAVVALSVPGAVTDNALLGNIVLRPTVIGIRLDSRCVMRGTTAPQIPCVDGSRLLDGTMLSNDVVIGGDEGISSAGAVGTTFDEVSVIDAANGLSIHKEPQNKGVASTSTTTNSLVADFQAVGFDSEGETTASFDHCASSGGYNPAMEDYVPGGNDTNALTAPPGPWACLAYLPAGSPLRGAGVGTNGAPADVGANVVDLYAADRTLTQQPLWSANGAFTACGATIGGVNVDSPTQPSCSGVGARLGVGTTSCPLPSP